MFIGLSQGCRCAPTAGLKLANAFGVLRLNQYRIKTEPVPKILVGHGMGYPVICARYERMEETTGNSSLRTLAA